MKKLLVSILSGLIFCGFMSAQVKTEGTKTTVDGTVEFAEIVHDFGDVITGSGPLTCTFTLKNVSDKPIAIYNVVASCGCTDVRWTREPLKPGQTGKIEVVYKNEDGPYPFDKNLTVYVSGVRKPIILRLRGTAHDKKLPLAQMYPEHLGNFALKETDFRCGNMDQGNQRSDAIMVANIGQSPLAVSFVDVSPGMDISVSPNPIPVGETAKMVYTITSDDDHWGKNFYYATPVVGGTKQKKISVWAFIKENFSNWSDEMKQSAASPYFESTSYNFGLIKAGSKVNAEFKLENTGKSDLVIHKVDLDNPKAKAESVPVVKAGKKGIYKFSLDTSGMKKGEVLVIVTLTTNTPNRPIANLFITGALK